jgi:hypothetical protein
MEEKGVQDNWGREGRELYRLERRKSELYRMGEVVGSCRLDQVMVTYLAR